MLKHCHQHGFGSDACNAVIFDNVRIRCSLHVQYFLSASCTCICNDRTRPMAWRLTLRLLVIETGLAHPLAVLLQPNCCQHHFGRCCQVLPRYALNAWWSGSMIMVYRFLKTVHKAICFCRIRANILTLLCNLAVMCTWVATTHF